MKITIIINFVILRHQYVLEFCLFTYIFILTVIRSVEKMTSVVAEHFAICSKTSAENPDGHEFCCTEISYTCCLFGWCYITV